MSEKGKEVEKSEIVEKEIKKGKMSEKGREGDEREMVDHWSHEHPLTLVETRGGEYCYGCEDRFGGGEQAYGCSMEGCDYSNLLHEECAAMAREIRHPLHPQHTLIQIHQKWSYRCHICMQSIRSIGYICSFCNTNGASTDEDDDADDAGDDDQIPSFFLHSCHSGARPCVDVVEEKAFLLQVRCLRHHTQREFRHVHQRFLWISGPPEMCFLAFHHG